MPLARHDATLKPSPDPPPPAGDRAAAIIAAAEACFIRYGIARTRVEDIAAEIRIPRPHVYRHFASKDAIVHAVIVTQIKRHHGQLAKRFPHSGPAADLIIGSIIAGIRQAPPGVAALTSDDAAHITAQNLASSPEIVALIRSHWEPVLEYARDRGELRAGVDIPEAARWLLFVQFSYLALPALIPAGDRLETDLRAFILPALLGAD